MTHRKPQDVQNDVHAHEHPGATPLDRSAPAEEHTGHRARPRVVARVPAVDMAELDRVAATDAAATDEQPRHRRLTTLVLTGGSAMLLVVALIALPFGKQRLFNARGPHWEDNSPAPAAPMAPRWGGAADGSSGSTGGGYQASKTPTTVPVTASISSAPVAPLPGETGSSSATSGAAGVPNSSANPAAPTITLPDPTQGTPSWSLPSSAPIPAIPSPAGSSQSSATSPRVAPYPATPYGDGFEQMNSGPGYAGTSDRPQAASQTVVSSAPTVEPGVARLEGTIEKQAQRPAHDVARPSLY